MPQISIAGASAADETVFERDKKIALCKMLARTIHSNRDLRKIIRKCEPDQREIVYNFLLPHLPFKPLSYLLIKP